MRQFDVTAKSYNLAQYWASSQTTSTAVTGQVSGTGVSNITFGSDVTSGNRNIVSDASKSIHLGTAGVVTAPEFTDFSLGMLIYPEVSDVWVVRFGATLTPSGYTDTYSNSYEAAPSAVSIGVKVHADSTISLIWIVEDQVVEDKIVFTEQLCYLALTKVGRTVTLQVNNELKSFEGPDGLSFEGFDVGGGGGNGLVDKIAFATGNGTIPRPLEYFSLFRMQRLDGVARPPGEVGFSYVNDITTPMVITLNAGDFNYEDGYNYGVMPGNENSVWELEKRAGFPMEVSTDFGENWFPMPTKGWLQTGTESLIFRHAELTDQNYFIKARLSGAVTIPVSFFDVVVTGNMYLPEFIGDGYFDVEQAKTTEATITITKQNLQIRSVEFLGEINGASSSWLDTTGASVYVNGVPGSLAAMKPNQIYHVIVTWPAGKDSVVINPGASVESSLAGVGASATPYTQADAFYIFNSFSRNTFLAGLESISSLSDGIAPNAQTPGEPVSAVNLQWNS